jgi:hypothetical protein
MTKYNTIIIVLYLLLMQLNLVQRSSGLPACENYEVDQAQSVIIKNMCVRFRTVENPEIVKYVVFKKFIKINFVSLRKPQGSRVMTKTALVGFCPTGAVRNRSGNCVPTFA